MKKTQTLTQLKKLFQTKVEDGYTTIEPQDQKIYMDVSNVIGFIPKTIEARELIKNNFEVSESNIPKVEYDQNTGVLAIAKFSTDYLKIILDFIKTTEESGSINLTLSKDYPLKVELTHYIIYLAPRVDN